MSRRRTESSDSLYSLGVGGSFSGGGGGQSHSNNTNKTSPLNELSQTLDRLEYRIHSVRESYRLSLIPSSAKTTQQSTLTLGERLFGRKLQQPPRARSNSPVPSTATDAESPGLGSTPDKVRKSSSTQQKGPVADFITFRTLGGNESVGTNNASSSESAGAGSGGSFSENVSTYAFIEDLRRVAELCIIGENYVTSVEKKKAEAFKREQEKWALARDGMVLHSVEDISENGLDEEGRESSLNENVQVQEEKKQLFDLFFEKNGLDMIVNLLTGKTFQLTDEEKAEIVGYSSSDDASHSIGQVSAPLTPVRNAAPVSSNVNPIVLSRSPSLDENSPELNSPDHPCNKIMLPPLPIAIQALQSISILIQNVSRATSLYVILSSNRVNSLIDLPLNLYSIAEQRRQRVTKENRRIPGIFANQSITELTTHFVTFLKSLAMRMNAETLQFFLKYPTLMDGGSSRGTAPSGGKIRIKRVLKRSKSNERSSRNLNLEEISRGVSRTTTAPAYPLQRRELSKSKSPVGRHRSMIVNEISTLQIRDKRRNMRTGDDSKLTESSESNGALDSLRTDELSGSDELSQMTIDFFRKVEFPLYDRALEFCGAEHDGFVRLTAMNICLNTLRLTTVVEDDNSRATDQCDSSIGNKSQRTTPEQKIEKISSPDGVLHNATALPFRERLAIAQFACIPPRVERLMSPIFSKLAERWTALEEHIRTIDSNKHMGLPSTDMDMSIGGSVNSCHSSRATGGGRGIEQLVNPQNTDQVRQKRVLRDFKDKVSDLLDELYLLDDVFKVGLTVLNEQTIEMMLATFIYPLLLQPLLIYYKELTQSVDASRFSFTDHPFGGVGVDLSDIDKKLLLVSGPAKAALLTLGYVFHSISNRPLLRLLYTILLHPLSPDSTSAPTIRAMLDVAAVDILGRRCIRVDNKYERGTEIPNERATYTFGRSVNTRKNRERKTAVAVGGDREEDVEACVFVLAPGVAEVLEYRGRDVSVLSNFTPNQYRRAFLGSLRVPDDMSDIRELATCTFDAVVSVFDPHFLSAILFGEDLDCIADNNEFFGAIPEQQQLQEQLPEGDETSQMTKYESRFINEVLEALVDSTIFANRIASSDWKVGYDEVGAHALLCSIRAKSAALMTASKLIEERTRRAAQNLVSKPSSGLMPMGGTNFVLPGSPSINDDNYEELMFHAFLDHVFFQSVDINGLLISEECIVHWKNLEDDGGLDCFSTVVSTASNSTSLSSRIGSHFKFKEGRNNMDDNRSPFDPILVNDRREESISCIKLDALNHFLRTQVVIGGTTLLKSPLTGVTFNHDGLMVPIDSPYNTRHVLSPLSINMTNLLFAVGSESSPMPMPLSSIELGNMDMLPCVCETPASAAYLFADGVTGVIADGITWQSLYIVFVGEFLVFAQPVPGQNSGGMGRVISSCALANIMVELDPPHINLGGPARRLLLSYKWVDHTPPPLFMFHDVTPPPKTSPPFVHLQSLVSRLDVWFEHERAVEHAFTTITNRIFQGKVQRGIRLRSFLSATVDET